MCLHTPKPGLLVSARGWGHKWGVNVSSPILTLEQPFDTFLIIIHTHRQRGSWAIFEIPVYTLVETAILATT